MELPLAGRIGIDHIEARQPPAGAQHQVARYAFRRRLRQDGVRIAIVAKRTRERDIDAGARQIDSGIERIAAAGERQPPVAAARELDHDFADADDAGFLLVHGLLPPTRRNARID